MCRHGRSKPASGLEAIETDTITCRFLHRVGDGYGMELHSPSAECLQRCAAGLTQTEIVSSQLLGSKWQPLSTPQFAEPTFSHSRVFMNIKNKAA